MPIVLTLVLTLVVMLEGCKDVSAALPAGTSNPALYNTPAGALQKRNAADSVFQQAFFQYVIDAGLISDELEDPRTGGSLYAAQTSGASSLDERILPQASNASGDGVDGSNSYTYLQQVRGATSEAIGALAKYDTIHSPAIRGEMYALQGYAEVMLAELFCSGVPLSTYDFGADFTYKPGSTQQQIYQDALAKFDTALALSSDSVRILNLARVGSGRAYLDLGDYVHAAAAVSAVPDDYSYQFSVQFRNPAGRAENALNVRATVSDSEGTNGLPFIASGDPRTQATVSYTDPYSGLQLYLPTKYAAALSGSSYAPITLASGVEARLIQAEAALNANDASWLTILNTLRTSAGVAGLTPLADSGATLSGTAAMDARVNLLFKERAYWLYVTGHRQGDLRRLVREYNRDQSTVYPVGTYLAPGQGVYGSDVNAPIPSSENPNPYFHGCLDRNA